MNRTLPLIPKVFLLSLGALTLVLIAFEAGWAANHYVLASATGNGSGSNWTDACTDFTFRTA